VIVEPAVAITTPWGNVVGAIWYCTLPAEIDDTGRDTEKASPFWVSPIIMTRQGSYQDFLLKQKIVYG